MCKMRKWLLNSLDLKINLQIPVTKSEHKQTAFGVGEKRLHRIRDGNQAEICPHVTCAVPAIVTAESQQGRLFIFTH